MEIIKEDDLENENVYNDIKEEIQALVASVSDTINKHQKLKNKNFGLFYQHGRLGYVDLDVFAKTIDKDKLIKATELAKSKKTIDKNEKK